MSNIKKIKQSDINPYEHSDTNKRYQTYDYWLKKTFGGKCMKLPVDAGFTCPNIDGKCSVGGCIYCSSRGSGDFAQSSEISVTEQLKITKDQLSSKWKTDRCIPYFQAHTNTYAPISVLKEKYEEALSFEGTVGLNIATRADCLADDVVRYLAEISERTTLTVELGLQTVHDCTAFIINRGHTFEEFVSGYNKLRAASDKINICVHLILGLPGEDREMMMESVRTLAKMRPDQVKFHLLHVIEGTALADMYLSGEYTPMEREDYIDALCEALTLMPKDTVIGRITGDGMQSSLLAPEWSRKKTAVINDIDKRMFEKNIYQGMNFKE